MKILVTGSGGFVGKNLIASLKAVQQGKDKTRGVTISEVFEFDKSTPKDLLKEYCSKADFVFNLAGVNRPKDAGEFMAGNFGFASELLECLEQAGNRCPVMISSSIQASMEGRYAGSDYAKSKLAGENLFFDYGSRLGVKVLVYRFPNLFGKWSRPNYNSVIATFCHNVANGLPITVNDPSVMLEMVYIDDLIDEMFCALRNQAHRCDFNGLQLVDNPEGKYSYVPVRHSVRLQEIVDLLQRFKDQPASLLVPEIPAGSFAKKLYSTYLSFLPAGSIKFPLTMHCDARGSFTEVLKTINCGQFSVNISKPGITKGQHWHHSKWEFFIVVSGKAIIQERRIGLDENGDPYPVITFEVSGDKIEAIHMLPGYTHNIINASDSEDLVTLMWANEPFDPARPDTFFEPV